MDNKHIPPLEPENPMSESLTDLPKEMEPLEDRPVIEELTFDSALPEMQTVQEEPEAPEPSPDASIPEETSFPESAEITDTVALQEEPELPTSESADAAFDAAPGTEGSSREKGRGEPIKPGFPETFSTDFVFYRLFIPKWEKMQYNEYSLQKNGGMLYGKKSIDHRG